MQYGGEKPRMQTQVNRHPLPATGQPPGSPEGWPRSPGPRLRKDRAAPPLWLHNSRRSKEDACPRRGQVRADRTRRPVVNSPDTQLGERLVPFQKGPGG